MMFQRLFTLRPGVAAGRALYAPLIEQARTAAFYEAGRVPDTVDGRFELYTLHLTLVARRLRREGEMAAEASQTLFDTFVSALDDALRELGVGDLSVSKKMRKMGEAIYGRFKSYETALAEGAAPEALDALIARTVYDKVEDAPVAALAAYVRATEAAFAATPVEAILSQPLPWPVIGFAEVKS